jgi:hypothetical protein
MVWLRLSGDDVGRSAAKEFIISKDAIKSSWVEGDLERTLVGDGNLDRMACLTVLGEAKIVLCPY